MSEPAKEKPKRTPLQWFGRALLWLVLGLLLFAIVLPIGGIGVEFGFLMLFGWVEYLGGVLPRISFNPEIAIDALVALALAIGGLHLILRWWKKALGGEATGWRFAWTAKLTAMALLLFATSIVATGIVHQAGWLIRADRLVEDRSRGRMMKALSDVKQVALGLRLYAGDHEGNLPREVEELFPDYLPDHNVFFVRTDQGEPPEMVLYFPDDRAVDADQTVVVATRQPFKSNKRAMARRDGSAAVVSEAEFQRLMAEQKAVFRQAIPDHESTDQSR